LLIFLTVSISLADRQWQTADCQKPPILFSGQIAGNLRQLGRLLMTSSAGEALTHMVLFDLTSVTDFLGLCLTLWLAGYLISRGFRSPTTLRAALMLLFLSLTFSESYISLHEPDKSHYAWYLAAYLLAVMVWYNLTYQWLPRPLQRRLRWTAGGIYGIGLITLVFVLLPVSGLGGPGPGLYIGLSRPSLFGLGNALMLLPAAIATLVNFRLGTRYGRGPDFNTLWLSALFGALAMSYGALSFLVGVSVPRLVLDWLVIAAMLMLAWAVARHQAFVERRTTLQDVPVSALAIVAVMVTYALITQRADFDAGQIALVTALAVFTHSVYDVARELLDHLLHQQESALRRQLRKLARDVGGPDTLAANLQAALNNLVVILRATGGFVAVKQGERYLVQASAHSLPLGQPIELPAPGAEDLYPTEGQVEQTAWLALARAGSDVLGAIGLGPRANRTPFSEEDLDLLVEAADSVGQLLQADAIQARSREALMTLAQEVETREVVLQSGAQDLIAAMESHLDRNFERAVEQCLQHLSDYTFLGQSTLTSELLIGGATHIERGRALREMLLGAIDSLRPAGSPPGDLVPSEWHAYTILHDAYVDDVPNRDIMSRLYVSEGTFNRRRRRALQSVARALLEAKHPSGPARVGALAEVAPDPGLSKVS